MEENAEKINKTFRRFLKQTPTRVGGISVKFYKDRFVRGGWIDTSFQKWRPRKKRDRNERRRGNRALLVQSGRLKRSIRVLAKNEKSVRVGTDVEYAKAHNEGDTSTSNETVRTHTRRAHSRRNRSGRRGDVKGSTVKSHNRKTKRNLPKRQFMGRSKFLNRRIEKTLKHQLKKELKKDGIID